MTVENEASIDQSEIQNRMAEDRWLWRGALGCLILAGLTGVLFRFGLRYGFTMGLDLGNVRHAHSHLMYLGWVTPVLFTLIARQLSAFTGQPVSPTMKGIIWATIGGALVAYPLFMAFGYQSVALGEARVPPAAVAAGLNMVVWYGFVVLYGRARRGRARTRTLLLWDLALAFLVLASLGAWGLSMLKPLGIDDPAWAKGLTHLFLDLFSEGWFVLAVLSLAYATLKPGVRTAGHWSLWLICLGLPVTFALGMPASLVPPVLKAAARLGSLLVAVGLLVNVWILWGAFEKGRAGDCLRKGEREKGRGGEETRFSWPQALRSLLPFELRGLWPIPLALLGAKLVVQLVLSLWPGVWWAELHSLRVFYLHLMLLGFVTLGLVAAATHIWGRAATRGRLWLYATVLLVIASLLPLTPVWPMAWRGSWILTAAAWIALTPVAAAVWMLLKGRFYESESRRT